jgi:excisionase family DNA binding protein
MSARSPSDKHDCDVSVGAGARKGRPAPRFFTLSEISKSLDVSTRTVRRWIKSGALVAHHFGGIVRISEADFLTFLALRRGR